MEVKDLIKTSEIEEITKNEEQEKEEALLLERKETFNKLTKYLQSDEYKELCEYFTKKWNALDSQIIKLVKERKETKWEKSELDKMVEFWDYLDEVLEKLWWTEWELIMKADLLRDKESVNSHILNKVEELFDMPVYSKADLLKQKRIDYLLLWKRIEGKVNSYADLKEEKQDLHPYED